MRRKKLKRWLSEEVNNGFLTNKEAAHVERYIEKRTGFPSKLLYVSGRTLFSEVADFTYDIHSLVNEALR